jgi:hypothetical protein
MTELKARLGNGNLPAAGGYESSRFNALRHGVLSRHTVLAWEDPGEYEQLLNALVAEHSPEGPTEEHIVEEIAGILWRKRRLRQAEGALYRRGLRETLEPFRETMETALVLIDVGEQRDQTAEALRSTQEDTHRDLHDLEEDQAMTERALTLLMAGKPGSYEKALARLHPETRKAWDDQLEWDDDDYDEGQEPYRAEAGSLARYLEAEISPWYEGRRKEIDNRPLIRTQAIGEALDPDRLGRLARYEVHLDRKLERTLAMLLKLRDFRREADAA